MEKVTWLVYLILTGIEDLDAVIIWLSILVCFLAKGIATKEALACFGAFVYLTNEAENLPGVLAAGDEVKYSDDPLPDGDPLIFRYNEVILAEKEEVLFVPAIMT